MHPIPAFCRRALSLLLAGAAAAMAAPPPMEPASRTLFVFVHGINPRCSGASMNGDDADSNPDGGCRDDEEETFCVDRNQILGRSAQVWLKNLDGDPDDRSLFCSLKDNLFQGNYSLRSFTNPGRSPISLAHELGDREWSEGDRLRSHAIEAMRRHLQQRMDRARERRGRNEAVSEFERDLLDQGWLPDRDLGKIFEAWPDSVPSRMVVFAHSMGGLTTRQYLMSDFFQQDLDKVFTFDTPHSGSWVARYNQQGVTSAGTSLVEEAPKIVTGMALMTGNSPVLDRVGSFLVLSGKLTMLPSFATEFAGFIGNGFLGNEKANDFMVPTNPDLLHLAGFRSIPCEAEGCKVPQFVVHTTDGVLSPENPDYMLGTGTMGALLPLEMVDAAEAYLLAGSRPWPGSMSKGEVLGSAIAAGSFAFGGWNYTQHGSLPVARYSSEGKGIPFLERSDVVLRKRLTVFDPTTVSSIAGGLGSASVFASLGSTLMGTQSILDMLSVQARLTPNNQAVLVAIKWGFLGAMYGGTTVDMAAYGAFNAKSHNAAIYKTATRGEWGSVRRADGTTDTLGFQEVQYDLHEAPFAQVASVLRVGDKGDSLFELRIDTGSTGTPKGLEIPVGNLLPIHYPDPLWETRWAVRHERHDPAGGGTRVRQVRRWNLPVEILTTSQPRSIDFQIDDLHPDRMEQMELALNYGLHRFVWDRETGKDTYTLTYFENGQAWTPTTGLPNPIDAYGRWHVELRDLIPSKYQVLLDGQNLMGISLVNGVGRHSAQRQFVTFQAAAPSLAMRFPQPWGAVSDPAGMVRFRADLLHYPGIRFDTAEAGWALVPRDSTMMTRPIEPEAWNSLTGLLASDSIQDLELPLQVSWGAPVDGPWDLALRIPTLQPASGQKGQPGTRRFPLWLDRMAPEFRIEAQARSRGEPWRFRLHWTDLPDGLPDVVQLVRVRVVDHAGKVVAELPPLEQAAVSGVELTWDGRIEGRPAPDGAYRLDVVGMDAAVADAATLESAVRLRRELYQAILEGRDPWGPLQVDTWSRLRNDRRLNWSAAQREFLVDRTAPIVRPEPLPVGPIGGQSRFQMACAVSDPGGSGRGVRMRLEFRDAATGAGFGQTRELAEVSTDGAAPTRWTFQEERDTHGMLPDGTWKIRALFEDADGNRDSVEVPGFVRIDRTLPMVRDLRASPSYLSSRSTESVGPAVVDAGDAASVRGEWISPEGARVPVVGTRDGSGAWTIEYPNSIRRQRGTWTLQVVATDSAGNASIRSTYVQVDLVPPRLKVPAVVDGPVVLTGLAMDPDLDAHAFSRYELSWRPMGAKDWSREGMRVPAGRGARSEPWRSRVPQSAEGVLGFWDPPQDLSGEIEVRVVVDDGTESVHEAIVSTYATSRSEAPFEAMAILPDTLRAGVPDGIGWSVRGRSEATPRAMAVLTDTAGNPLLATERDGIAASVADGRPLTVSEGSLHVWRQDSVWTLQAAGACRAMKALVQTRSERAVGVVCPSGWTCTEDTLPPVRLEQPDGGFLEVDRALTWTIPAGSRERLEWSPPSPSRVTILADTSGRSCPLVQGCPDNGVVLPRVLPAPGEVRLGADSRPVCDGTSSLAMRGGKDRASILWDGFRLDGNWPAGGEAVLDVDLWDPASMRVVHASTAAPLRPGVLALGARALGAVVRDGEGPGARHAAALEYTVEGRAAKVGLTIRSGDQVVRHLGGDGSWREGRSVRRPWTVEWDGTDDRGDLVAAGRYRFVVEAEDRMAAADVEVGGEAWSTDTLLRLSFAPGEATWNPSMAAWQLQPPAEVLVQTGVKAQRSGQELPYQLRFEGTQDVVAFRTYRPSLMVRRKRNSVKFGLLWKVTTIQYGYDSKQSAGGCGDRSGGEYNDVPVTRYLDGGVLDIKRGQVLSRQVRVHVQSNTGETTWRMGHSGHKVEWVAVPLSVYMSISKDVLSVSDWDNMMKLRLSTGSFRIDQTAVTPTHGLIDVGAPVEQGSWTEEPPAPRTCQASTLAATDLDGVLDGRDWRAGHCPDVPTNEEVVNPNRNLLQQNLKAIQHRMVADGLTPRLVPSFIWDDGTAGAKCASTKLTDFSFETQLRVPDRFFDADPGIDNLANRLLRFDASNRFLYGVGAYLSQDGIDNDGNGRSDDAAEAQGTISPFEKRSYEWRPLHSDLESQFFDCSGIRDIAVPEYCEEVSEGTFDCRPGDAPGTDWTPVGEPGSCDPYGFAICQTWRGWEQKTCQRTVLQASDTRGNILEDKLNFFEGDHSPDGDRLEMWFTNTPEEGTARFLATVGQGDRSWTLDSRTHQGREKALTIPLVRLSLSSSEVGGEIRRQFEPRPVRITVGVDGDLFDATSSAASRVPLPWPLDESSWNRAKNSFESACASIDAVDPSACRRLHLAASGVRLGFDDGLAPSLAGTAYRSLAQERFFRDRAAGRPANPDGLPLGRIPSGSGTMTWMGTLAPDALGRSVFVDSLHARLPRLDPVAGALLTRVVPMPSAGLRAEGPDPQGWIRWFGDSLPTWSLADDPRTQGRSALGMARIWNSGMPYDRVPLLDLYKSSAKRTSEGAAGISLYTETGSSLYMPNTEALSEVQLDSMTVRWRDGSDASSRFLPTALAQDASGYPAGVLVRRTGRLDGAPEWVALHGAVASGTLYQLGWSTPAGGWRALGPERVSMCTPDQAALGRCALGFVDVSLLPDRGRLLLRVRSERGTRYQSLPFLRGRVLPDSAPSAIASLFNDAEIRFPAGAFVGKPDSLRAVAVRLLAPHEAGIPPEAGIALTGPVIEVSPSQTFPSGARPELVVRLPREAFAAGGLDPSLVRLFRIDPQLGHTTLLEEQMVRYFRDGQVCPAESGWTVAEFHARTPSFSRFALLPASVRDTRSWSLSISPAKSVERERALELNGLDVSDLTFHWDDDPVFSDASDPTPPVEFSPHPLANQWGVLVPERSRSWLTARERGAGLPRTVGLEWIRGDFAFTSLASDTVVVGTLDGAIRIPYLSSHSGILRMAVQGGSGAIAWLSDTLGAGSSTAVLAAPSSWGGNGEHLSTRLVAMDEAGRAREVPGPVLRPDSRRPAVRLSGSVRPTTKGWMVRLDPSMTDSDGQVARGSLELELDDGTRLGSWAGDASVEVEIPSVRAGARVRASLVGEDLGGNRGVATWETRLLAPEQEALLWLHVEGDATRGWQVVDRGRRRLEVEVVGSPWWSEGAVVLEDQERLATDTVSYPPSQEATLEVFGAWSPGAILLARDGGWELRREGANVVYRQGDHTATWSGVFTDHLGWRHLALVLGARSMRLMVDGQARETLPWDSALGLHEVRRWTLGGGQGSGRLVLARVWPTSLDVERITALRAAATGLDSVVWQEAEQMVGGAALTRPHCALPSRLAVRTPPQGVRLEMDVHGPRVVTLAGRWRSRGARGVTVWVDGVAAAAVRLPERGSWGPVVPWTVDGAPAVLNFGPGLHRVSMDLPEGLELDGVALVCGAGDPARWSSPDVRVEPRVEVLARDESPTDPVHFRPRLVVRNLGSEPLPGYRMHLQVRTERGRAAIVDSWWPQDLITELDQEDEGIFGWSLDRSDIVLGAGERDFGGAGPAVGFHHDDWSAWDRTNDPVWDASWRSGAWTKAPAVAVTSTSGHLLAPWSCQAEVPPAPEPEEAIHSLEGSGVLVVEGSSLAVVVKPMGTWAWNTTMLGISPLDGLPLDGLFVEAGVSTPLAGWWQTISLPNAEHQDKTLRLTFPSTRRIQIQRWEQ